MYSFLLELQDIKIKIPKSFLKLKMVKMQMKWTLFKNKTLRHNKNRKIKNQAKKITENKILDLRIKKIMMQKPLDDHK